MILSKSNVCSVEVLVFGQSMRVSVSVHGPICVRAPEVGFLPLRYVIGALSLKMILKSLVAAGTGVYLAFR